VHAVVGENGAGKSTLMKLLAGVERPDAGRILLDGRPVELASPLEARRRGIAIVFQELSLFPHLSVAANIFANREISRPLGLLCERAMLDAAREVLGELGVVVDPRARVQRLASGQRQLVEISRAVSVGARIVILDEPNSALTGAESERLFALVRRLRQRGVTILYVSHRLEEVLALADRISVLRDGRHQGTWRTAETDMPRIVRAMVGRRLDGAIAGRAPAASSGEVLLEARGLTVSGRLGAVTFELRAGEVLGLAGLEGSGVDVLFRALFGLEPEVRGKVACGGESRPPRSPSEAMRRGLGLVPRNRREEGLIMGWPLRKNATLLVLERLCDRLCIIDRARERHEAEVLARRLRVVAESVEKKVALLSGGNQQKVVLAKWLAAGPRILLLDDPTRGVDVGAKAEVHRLIDELAAQGLGILITSSEVEEVLGLADRVLVLARGNVVREIQRGAATKAEVMEAMAAG
jgi:ABC-type sugar transport system ATPase subunit